MAETGMSFREVPLNKRFPPKCREITHTTGGASGSLQDQKQVSYAGGYAYRDSGCLDSPVRNRFIYWRTAFDVLELTEESLDVNLTGNHLRVCFQGAPILGKISVHEAHSYVFILVATTSSLHRLMFPHPNKIHKNERGFLQGSVKNAASILSDASLASVRGQSSSHVITSPTGSVYHVHTAAGWLTNDGEAVFALATNTGSILLVKFPPYGIQGVVMQHELKQTSVIQRLWSGLVPSVIRGGNESSLICSSLEIHPIGQDIFIFSISYDNKIRMWSAKTQECVMVTSMTEFMPAGDDGNNLIVGNGGHRLCKAVSSASQSVNLGVYLTYSGHCMFCVFQPVLADGQYQLNHISTIHGPNEELVDLSLSSTHLWTLWTSSDGESMARTVPIVPGTPHANEWLSVFMEPSDTAELEVPAYKDPRQTYTDYIFYPGRFSNYAILRALKTYRRTLDPTSNLDVQVSRENLVLEVISAVEHEIQTGASEYELAEDEYHQLQLQQWARFYSCCTQYKQVGLKPLGIFADSVTGMTCLVRKNCASLVRPSHILEHLYLATTDVSQLEDSTGQNILEEDESVCQDVVRLCSCIRMLGNCLTSTMEQACEQDLYHTQNPNIIAQQLISALLTEASLGEATVSSILRDIEVNMYNIHDLSRAIDCLLRRLDLAHGHPEGLAPYDEMTDAGRQLSCSLLYSSVLATETLTRSVYQMSDTALHLSRDLLLFLTLIVDLGQQASVPLSVVEQIRSEFISRTAMIVPQYFVLRWCATTIVTPTPSRVIESNLRQLEAIDFSDSSAVTLANRIVESGSTLLEKFLEGYGGVQMRAHLATFGMLEDEPCALWSRALVPISTVLSQLIWPVSANFSFAEFLLVTSQYTQLQEYVRLTRDWCDWNEASRKFMLAFSYLNTGEANKALDQFVESVHGVSKDAFLKTLLRTELSNPKHAEVLFLLKVIRLFELFDLPHLVVSLASTAIMIAEDADPNLPTLWSKVFKHHLQLGHNDDAYNAMVSNPDPSRRKDCLRQLLVVLCERGQLQQLVEFPYIDLHDEVVSILESRARSVDLTSQNYYDLLYSFHIYRGNYRKAGSVMYEYGLRLGREVPGLKGLQRQAKCYLAALNALRLVDPKYAWIVKPGAPSKTSTSESDDMDNQSPKHSWDGEEVDEQPECSLDVLELADLEKEYLLVHARLRLLQKDPDPARMTGPTSSAADTIALLCNAGLFDCAINICRLFNMPLTPVFEGVASRCVRLAKASSNFQQGDNEYTANAWAWLEDNDLGGIGSHTDVSSADQAWRVLQLYLEKHEDKTTRYHKAVAVKLLSEGFSLPSWFITSYKRMNAAELLRLYLNYDLLEECGELALEYIDAVLGRGSEYFGLKSCLSFSAPSVWLPYTSIDQLLIALGDVDTDSTYRQLYERLCEKLEVYHRTVEQVTKDVILAAQQQAKEFQFRSASQMDVMET